MIVEPNTSGRLEENIHPLGKAQLSVSATISVPAALAQQGPHALGTHAGEQTLQEIVTKAGFSRFAKIAETPMVAVYEARQ